MTSDTSLVGVKLPTLKGYVLLAEAARILGVQRQHAYRLAKNKELKEVYRLGTSNYFVVSTKEVERYIKVREARAAEQAKTAEQKEKAAT